MKDFAKLALPQLIILLVYSVVFRLMGNDSIILEAIVIMMQVGICFILAAISFAKKDSNKSKGGQYLLISFLVLLIGFGTCMGLFTLNIH